MQVYDEVKRCTPLHIVLENQTEIDWLASIINYLPIYEAFKAERNEIATDLIEKLYRELHSKKSRSGYYRFYDCLSSNLYLK